MRRFLPLLMLTGCTMQPSTPVTEPVGFQSHMLPLFKNRCAACHNESIPRMNWLNYETAKKNRGKILQRVVSRTMPPNGALQPGEIELIKAWVRQGAKP